MKPHPDSLHRYRVNTEQGVRWLNEEEKETMMQAVLKGVDDETKGTMPIAKVRAWLWELPERLNYIDSLACVGGGDACQKGKECPRCGGFAMLYCESEDMAKLLDAFVIRE